MNISLIPQATEWWWGMGSACTHFVLMGMFDPTTNECIQKIYLWHGETLSIKLYNQSPGTHFINNLDSLSIQPC